MDILILEGAQGGGKSHLYNYLIKTYKNIIPAKPVTAMLRPRSMVESSDGGAYLSILTDLDWFLTAVKKATTNLDKKYVYVIDRHVVSQWVYQNIGVTPVSALDLERLWLGWLQVTREIFYQYKLRLPHYPTQGYHPQFHFAFYQPSLEELMQRRSHDISKYPFDPRQELHRYSVARKTLEKYCPVAVYTEEQTEEEIGEDIHASLLGLQPIKRNIPIIRDGEGT